MFHSIVTRFMISLLVVVAADAVFSADDASPLLK
jgi:hypothetical protein